MEAGGVLRTEQEMAAAVATPDDTRSREYLAVHQKQLLATLEEADARSGVLRAELEASENLAGSCRAALGHLEEASKVREMPSPPRSV